MKNQNNRTRQYTLFLDHGNHAICLIIADSSNKAAKFIHKKYGVELDKFDDSECFFYGHEGSLLLYIHSGTTIDYILHECIHAAFYMNKRMSLKHDEESLAYVTQTVFKKIIDKLIQIKKIEINYL